MLKTELDIHISDRIILHTPMIDIMNILAAMAWDLSWCVKQPKPA